jgi:hypothetical protein
MWSTPTSCDVAFRYVAFSFGAEQIKERMIDESRVTSRESVHEIQNGDCDLRGIAPGPLSGNNVHAESTSAIADWHAMSEL